MIKIKNLIKLIKLIIILNKLRIKYINNIIERYLIISNKNNISLFN
jgi:hypothetical protein